MVENAGWAWDADADVIVVGAGGAGLMAALTAAEQGASVLALEKASRPGGKTAIAIGSFTASETALQRAAGIADSHEDHLADMAALADSAGIALDIDRARLRIEEDARTLALLIELGMPFNGPHPEAPHRAPRMHNTTPGPQVLIDLLVAACEEKGVRFMTGCAAMDLLMGGDGRPAGLVAAASGSTLRLRAGAIVLSAGDYIANRSLLRRIAPDAALAEPILPMLTGDAFAMAARIGARTTNMGRVGPPQIRTTVWPHIEPSPGLFELGAVLLDRAGEPQPAAFRGTEAPADDLFLVIDARVAASLPTKADDVGPGRDGWRRTGKPFIGTAPDVAYAYLEDCSGAPWHTVAGTTGELARHLGCAPETVENELGGKAEPPFHVLGPMRRYMMGAGGALSTDTDMNVLNADGAPIPGLFAAGDTASWMEYAGGHGYGISWATTSGRLAGAAAARSAGLGLG